MYHHMVVAQIHFRWHILRSALPPSTGQLGFGAEVESVPWPLSSPPREAPPRVEAPAAAREAPPEQDSEGEYPRATSSERSSGYARQPGKAKRD